jgi:hypothetical protein
MTDPRPNAESEEFSKFDRVMRGLVNVDPAEVDEKPESNDDLMIVRVIVPPFTPADWEEGDECYVGGDGDWDGRTLGATVDLRAHVFLESLRAHVRFLGDHRLLDHRNDSRLRNKLKFALWIEQHMNSDQELIELPTDFNFERGSDYHVEGMICPQFEAVTCPTCDTRFSSDSLSWVAYDTLGFCLSVLTCPAHHHLFVTLIQRIYGA